jgi:hypothetical protein
MEYKARLLLSTTSLLALQMVRYHMLGMHHRSFHHKRLCPAQEEKEK